MNDGRYKANEFFFLIVLVFVWMTMFNVCNKQNDNYWKEQMRDSFKGVIDITDSGEVRAYGWKETLTGLKEHKGKRFYYEIGTKRSSQQNRLMHKWIGLLADYTGEDFNKMKRDLKVAYGKLWIDHVDEKTGECFKELRSTASLTVSENKDFLDWMDRFAQQELNYTLPHPGDTQEMKF